MNIPPRRTTTDTDTITPTTHQRDRESTEVTAAVVKEEHGHLLNRRSIGGDEVQCEAEVEREVKQLEFSSFPSLVIKTNNPLKSEQDIFLSE